jgi:hypothetical protein
LCVGCAFALAQLRSIHTTLPGEISACSAIDAFRRTNFHPYWMHGSGLTSGIIPRRSRWKVATMQPSASAVSFGVIQSRVSCGGSGRRLRGILRVALATSFGWSNVMSRFIFFPFSFCFLRRRRDAKLRCGADGLHAIVSAAASGPRRWPRLETTVRFRSQLENIQTSVLENIRANIGTST